MKTARVLDLMIVF